MASTDYSELTVKELKDILRERGLPVSGNKQILIDRLIANDATAVPPVAEPQSELSGRDKLLSKISDVLKEIANNVSISDPAGKLKTLWILYRLYLVQTIAEKKPVVRMLDPPEFYYLFASELYPKRNQISYRVVDTIIDRLSKLPNDVSVAETLDPSTKNILYSAYGVLAERCELLGPYHN